MHLLTVARLLTTGFALTASYFLLTRFARPSGQPADVTPLRYVGLRERESNQRESAPGIRVSLRETPLVPALFRGASRWAIPGPSFLIWHPCQMPLYTAPPLGLLTGPGDRGDCEIRGSGLDRDTRLKPTLQPQTQQHQPANHQRPPQQQSAPQPRRMTQVHKAI